MAIVSNRQVKKEISKAYSKTFDSKKRINFVDVLTNKQFTKKIEDVIEYNDLSLDFIISIPHSGRLVPVGYINKLRDIDKLIEIDMHSDIVYDLNQGILIKSNLAPFIVDMNRSRSGSSNVPRHLRNDPLSYLSISGKPVLKNAYSKKDKEDLIRYYDLYHELLSEAILTMKREKGYALVLDGHSMTSVGLRDLIDKGAKREDFIIGTLGGKSVHPKIFSAFYSSLADSASEKDFTVMSNKTYEGGFITRNHHDTANDVHVIQLEVNMNTYMYEGFIKDKDMRYHLKRSIILVRDAIEKALISATEVASEIYN